MQILITGGAGLLGTRLARAILARGSLTDGSGATRAVSKVTLFDIAPAAGFDDPRVMSVVGDVASAADIATVLTPQTDAVFHLAAVVSGQAEADFDLGMRINLDATRMVLERARANGNRPKFIFTSSVAAFGGTLPARVPDDYAPMPQSSYGMQKVAGELIVNEYSRRGFIDGRVLRMPTVCVRPGAPNRAASSFASGIIREPLNGIDTLCPVAPETVMWLASPTVAIANMIHGHEVDGARFGNSRILSLPGLSVSVGEMAAALARVAGSATAARITWERDPSIERIVNSWPGDFITDRAGALGFARDATFDDIVRAYVEQELGGKLPA